MNQPQLSTFAKNATALAERHKVSMGNNLMGDSVSPQSFSARGKVGDA